MSKNPHVSYDLDATNFSNEDIRRKLVELKIHNVPREIKPTEREHWLKVLNNALNFRNKSQPSLAKDDASLRKRFDFSSLNDKDFRSICQKYDLMPDFHTDRYALESELAHRMDLRGVERYPIAVTKTYTPTDYHTGQLSRDTISQTGKQGSSSSSASLPFQTSFSQTSYSYRPSTTYSSSKTSLRDTGTQKDEEIVESERVGVWLGNALRSGYRTINQWLHPTTQQQEADHSTQTLSGPLPDTDWGTPIRPLRQPADEDNLTLWAGLAAAAFILLLFVRKVAGEIV